MLSAPTKPLIKGQSWGTDKWWKVHGLVKQHASEITKGGGRGREGGHGNLNSILEWEPHDMDNESDSGGM